MKAAAHGIPPPACQKRHNFNRSNNLDNGNGCGVKSNTNRPITPKTQTSKMVMMPLLRLDSVGEGEGASFEGSDQPVHQQKTNTVDLAGRLHGTSRSKFGLGHKLTPEPNSFVGKLCHFVRPRNPTLTSKHLTVSKTHSICALDELLNSRQAVRPIGSKSGVQTPVKMAQPQLGVGLAIPPFNRYGQWGVMCPSYPLLPKGVFPCHVFRAIQSQGYVFMPQAISGQSTTCSNGSWNNQFARSGVFDSASTAAANYICDRSAAYFQKRIDFSKATEQEGLNELTEALGCNKHCPKTASNMESKRADHTVCRPRPIDVSSSQKRFDNSEDTDGMISAEKPLACGEQICEIPSQQARGTCFSPSAKGDECDYDYGVGSNVIVATSEPEIAEQPLEVIDVVNAEWNDCESDSAEADTSDSEDEPQCWGDEINSFEFRPFNLESFLSRPSIGNQKGSHSEEQSSDTVDRSRSRPIRRALQEARRRWDKHYSSVNCQESRSWKVTFKCGPDDDVVLECKQGEGEFMTAMELQKIRDSQNSKDEKTVGMSLKQSITDPDLVDKTEKTNCGNLGDQVKNMSDASDDVFALGVNGESDKAISITISSGHSSRGCANISAQITCAHQTIHVNHCIADVGKGAMLSKDCLVCAVGLSTDQDLDDHDYFLKRNHSVVDSDSDDEQEESASESEEEDDLDDDDVVFADE